MKIERYEFELATRESTDTFQLASLALVEQRLERLPATPLFLLIGAIGRNVDYGNFLIWTDGIRAYAELHEHREHIAQERTPSQSTAPTTLFCDADGTEFTTSLNNTIAHDDAFAALLYWLKTMERPTNVVWS